MKIEYKTKRSSNAQRENSQRGTKKASNGMRERERKSMLRHSGLSLRLNTWERPADPYQQHWVA